MSVLTLQHAVEKGEFSLSVDTTIPATGVTGVFGESGSGKTTLLRCIAGLERSTDGEFVPVHRRNIGFVFQEPRLFPHLSVRRNIEYGLRRNANAAASLDSVVALLELETLVERMPVDLSGGEAQRVSIARILCQSPQLILMDEPLSALDDRRRDEVLPYLERLHRDSSVPIVYVSHNIDEICRLSDHLLVLERGRIVAEGSLQETLSRVDVAALGGRFAGAVLHVEQRGYELEFDLTTFSFSGGDVLVPGQHDEQRARLRIRASDISLSRVRAETTTILNILPVLIDSISEETQSTALVRLRAGEDILIARVTRKSLAELGLNPGDNVFAQIKSVTVRY